MRRPAVPYNSPDNHFLMHAHLLSIHQADSVKSTAFHNEE
jgi:hypothetical protein